MIKVILLLTILITLVFGEQPLQKNTFEKLNYVIIKQEKQRKGASFNPPLPAEYTLLVITAALTGDSKLNKNNVTNVLNKILSEVRKNNKNVDGITTYLYKSKRHFKDGSSSFGSHPAEPEGYLELITS